MPKITIKAARVNAGLTQKQAAEKLGIAYQTLSKYESDPSDITLELLDKMSKVYGIAMRFFLR